MHLNVRYSDEYTICMYIPYIFGGTHWWNDVTELYDQGDYLPTI